MRTFKLFSTKLWIWILCPTWSFIINLCYWICRPFSIREALSKKEALLKIDIKDVMATFKWSQDKYQDWYPWIITIVNTDLRDDCDGAATLAKWWWSKQGVKSRLVFLYSENLTLGHAVCVLNSNTIFVTNSEVLDLDPNNWKQDLLSRFNNTYSIIVEK